MRKLSLETRLYLWACQRLYHELARGYDLVSWLVSLGHWSRWRRAALAFLPDGDSSQSAGTLRILELGFGTGTFLIEMACRGVNVHGLEISSAMQRVTAAKVRRHGLTIPRVQALSQAAPYQDGIFDVIVSTFPAAYIFETATLCECARLLRPSGRLVIVGAWVRLAHPVLSRAPFPFFGVPEAEIVDQICVRLHETGFTPRVAEFHDGVARISVIVGEKLTPNGTSGGCA